LLPRLVSRLSLPPSPTHPSPGAARAGFFKLGDELTSKRRDWKEGLYLGAELPLDHPKVRARVPMHGPNQWPDAHRFPGFDQMIVEYMAALNELGHRIMEAVALSLSLDRAFFRRHFTEDPFTPFRLFYYPVARSPAEAEAEAKGMRTLADTYAPVRPEELRDGQFGVARHTDYGILTILYQDESGGLQVENRCGQWIDAPPLPGTFVVNIGDMLETWTSGLYRATPHRVLKSTRRNRLSAPFFFDPSFDCEVVPLARAAEAATAAATAAQQQPIHYGSYILRKVQNNFPEYAQTLAAEAKAPAPPQPETKA
jgi:polar amino acid transport system ATP-binding protein